MLEITEGRRLVENSQQNLEDGSYANEVPGSERTLIT